MDVKNLIENLKVDLTCFICLCYFTDPVIVKCGHTFCKECLLSCWKEDQKPITCPTCKAIVIFGDFLSNRRLQNLAIIGKMIRPHLLQSISDLTICEKHGKEETLFCEEDHRLLCGPCSLMREHEEHTVLPLEKAAGQCMEKFQAIWNTLKSKKKEVQIEMEWEKMNEEQWKVEGQTLKDLVVSEYEKMHQFLLEEEEIQLQRLDKEQVKDNLAKVEESKAKMTQQIYSLQTAMSEIEKKFEMLPIEILLDGNSTLERYDQPLLQNSVSASPEWTMYPIPGMTEMLLNFHREITLDSKTANSDLILSEDLKSVEYVSVPQNVPNNPEIFAFVLHVLATQSFTSGKHYWEVEVGNKTEWEVGICKEPIRRKGNGRKLPGDTCTLVAFEAGNDFRLHYSYHDVYANQPFHKVGIFLDYERGHIAFYNATDGTLIYSPPNDAFQGPLCPCFSVCIPKGRNTSGLLRICTRGI
ncbi:probable E3 ubiquitin-protein ligase TRIML1 [Notamacropus eugenii]|uniref:probable E3 ubiquitin-protein ligase TRIML1 n=1 Tax=Notamacropus eugenii TaxID=9315 RepID=UPI003B66F55B